jgi:2-polyprenyl-6-methoxyphenol hydroxylase-like FAD-dependent oxidoreductase
MNLPIRTDVLIVGAGPTGLMLANQLARRGVNATIIDRHAGPSVQTRALGVHARTLEIYAHLGIAEQALALGKRAAAMNMWTEGRHRARVPLGDIGRDLSPYPFILILGQDDNERLLGDALRQQGRGIHWNTELIDLEQQAEDVRITLRLADRSMQEIRARWVAGCDGAHSAVRHLNRIEFPGAPYEHVFFVADTTATGPMTPDELNIYLWRDEFHLFFPMRGPNHWRVVGIVPTELRERAHLTLADVETSVRRHAGAALRFNECRWFSTYRIHHRRAERFRDRRCFLLGDAAHIHSPVGAQGMNTGLQDAYNLAWKLALVVAGRAEDALLDTYQAERLPLAQRLLHTTDRAFSLIVSNRWFGRLLRTRLLARLLSVAMRIDRIRKLAFLTVSQIGIHYRTSALSQTLAGLPVRAPRAGDRFPWLRLSLAVGTPAADFFARLDDTRFNLLVIGQSVGTTLDDLVCTHTVMADAANRRELARAHIPCPSFYLLRPDGHIGLAGAQLDAVALRRYMALVGTASAGGGSSP